MSAKPLWQLLMLASFLGLQACEASLPSIQTGKKTQETSIEDDKSLLILGSPAEVWTGGDCRLGALEMAAYDGVTGQQLNGVLVNLKGSQFDGQLLPEQTIRLPNGFASGLQKNSPPRSYDISIELPPGYVRAEPARAVDHYNCKNQKNHFIEFNLFRTLEDKPAVEAF